AGTHSERADCGAACDLEEKGRGASATHAPAYAEGAVSTCAHATYQRTSIPGSAPLSGLSRKMSWPPGPAARIIPSEMPNFILRGARLATTTTSLPSSSSGRYLALIPAKTL